jgi:flagellar protein FliT
LGWGRNGFFFYSPEKISKFFQKNPKVPSEPDVNPDMRYSAPRIQGSKMTQVLATYEKVAGLTSQMVSAAQASDWDALDRMENQCAAASVALMGGAAPLQGEARKRKIELLKQIMANDRAIRDVTDSWQTRLHG